MGHSDPGLRPSAINHSSLPKATDLSAKMKSEEAGRIQQLHDDHGFFLGDILEESYRLYAIILFVNIIMENRLMIRGVPFSTVS